LGVIAKKITWKQLGVVKNKKVLDFGSGNGLSANHLAKDNEVISIEPDKKCWNLDLQKIIIRKSKEA
jgi:cyclopropane fatty-acyl-phospholipid synthase-like methyltransferase